jgi:hypothetical protein
LRATIKFRTKRARTVWRPLVPRARSSACWNGFWNHHRFPGHESFRLGRYGAAVLLKP